MSSVWVPFDRIEKFRILPVTCVGVILIILSAYSITNKETQKDTKRFPLAQMFLIASVLGTFFTFLLLRLKVKKYTILYYFLALCVMPLMIGLFHFAAKGFNFKALVFEVGIGLCFGWVIFIKVMSRLSRDDWFKSFVLPSFCCLTFPIFLVAVPLFMILNAQNIELKDVLTVIDAEMCFVAMIVSFIFFWYYWKFFYPKDADQDEFKNFLSEAFPEQEEQQENKRFITKAIKFLKEHRKLNFLPGIIVFVFFIGIYLFCLISLNECIKNLDFSAEFYLNLIYLILTPMMMFCGIPVSQLELSFDLKVNFFVGLFGLAPILVFLILFLKVPEYKQVFQYFLGLSPFFTVFWSFQSSSKSKIVFSWSLSLSCIFIAFPVGFLLPFGLFGKFNLIAVYSILGFFLLFPTFGLIYYISLSLCKFCKKPKPDKREILKKTTCYKTVLFLITTIFIISEGTLLYMYFTAPISSPATGAVLGMLIVISLLYIITSLTMQVSLNRALTLKLSLIILIFFSILILLSGILYSVLSDLGPEAEVACITCCISFILLMPLSLGLIQFKFRNPDVGKLLMVICNLTLWVFFVLPLGVGLPSALSRAKDSKSRNQIIGVATIFIGIVFMVGVSLVSILYNIYQKRMEKERKAIQCCANICTKMKSQRIRCDMITARLFYDKYSLHEFKRDVTDQWMAGFELQDAKNRQKYIKEYKIKSTGAVKEVKKITVRNLTVWELLNCFDQQDYVIENDDSDSDSSKEEIIKAETSIVAIDLNKLEILPDDEFKKIRPIGIYPDFDLDYKNIPVVNEEDLNINKFSQLFSQNSEDLSKDRSARKDWLGAVFDILALAPDDLIKENWMSLNIFLLFVKHGGINEELISNKRLINVYCHLTLQHKVRPLTKTVWVEEAVNALAESVIPSADFVKREKIIICDYFVTNLRENFVKLCKELEGENMGHENDIVRKHLISRKTKDLSCSDRNDLSKYIVRDDSENISRVNSQGISIIETSFLANSFHAWFVKKGEKMVKLFIRISKSLQNLLKKIYKEEDKQEQEKIENEEEKVEKRIGIIKEIDDANTFMLDTIDQISSTQTNKEQSIEKIAFSIPNIMTIIIKVMEIYQLSSLGFKKSVNWNFFSEPLARSSDVMLVENNPYFIPIFWICFSVALIYAPIAWYSKSKIIMSNIGKNQVGDNEKLTTSEGLRKFIILLIGSQLYMFIMKSQLSVFACNINEDPPVLWNTDIICYDKSHIAYFFCAIGCIMLYYPIATFIYPMLQFNDSKLQIKFQTTFVIILSQTKLIITAITVFLPHELYLIYQLIFASIVIFFLFIYFTIKKPCLARKMNNWMSAGYFIAFITNLMGLINIILKGSIVINILFFIVVFITIVVATVLHVKGLHNNRKVDKPYVHPFTENNTLRAFNSNEINL